MWEMSRTSAADEDVICETFVSQKATAWGTESSGSLSVPARSFLLEGKVLVSSPELIIIGEESTFLFIAAAV